MKRRALLQGSAGLGAVAALGLPSAKAAAPVVLAEPGRETLWYRQPAERWLQALPVGNGRLGAMMFGGLDRERLHLTESTVWAGAPSADDVNPDAAGKLDAIRQLFYAGRADEADALCAEHLLGRKNQYGTALPMAWLDIALTPTGEAEDYKRWLDLAEGLCGVDYRSGANRIRRELLASNPDGVIALHIACDGPDPLVGRIAFSDPPIPGRADTPAPNELRFQGRALETVHSDGSHGVSVECLVRVVAEGGRVTADDAAILVDGARALTILISAATDFGRNNPAATNRMAIDRARRKGYARIRAAHVADHAALYDRLSIRFGDADPGRDLPTDVRRQKLIAGETDPALSALFFQLGRYLTIAGSRANSPLPLALQGIWNDSRAAAMGWSDDFHIDINTQQNYWACEVANLAECHSSLWRFLADLRRHGARTAREMYGAEGWVAHVVTNPWGFTAPGWGNGWGIFVTGGVWMALDLWQHFEFGRDARFLRDTAWPVLRDAALFFLDYMVIDPRSGRLVTGPSISAENAYVSPQTGQGLANSMGPTCDTALVDTLFAACVDASAVLGIEPELAARLKAARQKLPPLAIGRYGQLQEWLEDYEEAQPGHRHTTHLVALYPYDNIRVRRDPALAAAARVTIERRLAQPDWEDTEWSRANLIAFSARLLDGEAAHRHVEGLIADNADEALLTFSRAGIAGAEHNIFAVDGNMAGTGAIAEMLLQSHAGEIELLPALPAAWPEGRIDGLRARGDVEVSITWADGALTSARLRAGLGGMRVVRYGDRTLRVDLPRGKWTAIDVASLRGPAAPKA